MPAMRRVNLSTLDLNLLPPLRALLEERHVTRAARKCALSQPAMSRSLERLRDVFADDLLVRSGRAYELTVRGERLRAELDVLIPRLESTVGGGDFDPTRATDRFRIALTDHACAVLLPSLLRQVRRAAPQSTLGVSVWHSGAYADVAAGRLDVALSAEAPSSPLEVEVLYEEEFVCLVGAGTPARRKRLTLREYLDRSHVVVETWGDQQTPVDVPLAQLGFKRRGVVRVPFFVPTILSIVGTDLTLTLPRGLASMTSSWSGLRTVEAPKEIKGFSYLMAWHPRLSSDPAHAWFREQVRIAARRL
jgi:DNA-binding transcriptional LysR family regulator